MKLIRVAAGVLNQTPMDWDRNRTNIIEAFEKARQDSVSVLCLPELSITGYGCEDAFYSPGLHETAIEVLESLAPESRNLITCVGLPIMYAGGVFNTACMLVDGRIAGFAAKQNLAGDGIHYEPRWFKHWPKGIQGEIEIGNTDYPIGDLLFDVGGIRIGFEICEDAWVGSRPGADHAARGADIILNPSASHFAFGKHAVRRGFVTEGSRAFHVTYVYSNLVGNEAGRAIYDGDTMIASNGELLATGPRLSFETNSITTQQVNIDTTRMSRARTGSFEPDVDGDESDVLEFDFNHPELTPLPHNKHATNWENNLDNKFEEFTRCVSLGLFDYLLKSQSHGFVVSLSGGADSAAATVLVSTAIRFAERELGFERLRDRLGSWAESTTDIPNLMRRLLTTVYQSTRQSSETTRSAAANVAAAVHSNHLELNVDEQVERYREIVGQALNLDLNWQDHDIALQNIQARTRAPSVWMVANIRNALLLSTSNRSESAVGYATMDGDTSGGLSPLAGIDKDFLRKWLVWMETIGPEGLGPIPQLNSVNQQQPTAELRPQSECQTDEADLMPYDVLDYIERLAIRDKMMPVDVFEKLRSDFDDYPIPQLAAWTHKFFTLWCQNQWKRERYAPSFHLDDENLDPKTWCRFPILSGGYRYELEKLDAHLSTLSING
ncbi:MAG: NAD(+) synthase [Mariniblastus sp.]|nr:NAD(+) synthase [Mariniblastus sp.]